MYVLLSADTLPDLSIPTDVLIIALVVLLVIITISICVCIIRWKTNWNQEHSPGEFVDGIAVDDFGRPWPPVAGITSLGGQGVSIGLMGLHDKDDSSISGSSPPSYDAAMSAGSD